MTATPAPHRGIAGTMTDDPMTDPVEIFPYQFQASYTDTIPGGDFPADDPMTMNVNELDDFINALNDAIALIEQDARYAQYTVDAVADLAGLIRAGREGEELVGENTWSVAAEVRSLIDQNRAGAPVAAFSATLPLTSVNPVAQIIAARGVSHDLRGAADEDVATVDTLLAMIAQYEQRAVAARDAINARLTRARTDVGGLRAGIATQMSRATSKEAEITTAASDANRLSAELLGTGESGGLEIEWRNLNRAIQAVDQGSTMIVFGGENPPSPNCNTEASCRTRLAELGTFDSDTNSIVGGLVEAKRTELTGKQADLRRFRTELAAINAEAARLRAAVQPNNQLLNDLVSANNDIDYNVGLIAAAERDVTAQQAADKEALADIPAGIESAKAAAIRTALEGIVNAPGATDPATPRFARDGNLADLTAAGAAVFARNPSAEAESPPALYADYGMWLEGTDAVPVLRTRMGLAGTDAEAAGTGDLSTAGTATYSGTARGLSARTVNEVTASGHFEADVSLSATFGASPTLGGTVRNFRAEAGQGGAHVGPWSIDLPATGPRAGTGDIRNAPFGNVGADGNPTAGGWSAYAYGLDGARPTGVYGGFQADFADGAAIGQFDAR